MNNVRKYYYIHTTARGFKSVSGISAMIDTELSFGQEIAHATSKMLFVDREHCLLFVLIKIVLCSSLPMQFLYYIGMLLSNLSCQDKFAKFLVANLN